MYPQIRLCISWSVGLSVLISEKGRVVTLPTLLSEHLFYQSLSGCIWYGEYNKGQLHLRKNIFILLLCYFVCPYPVGAVIKFYKSLLAGADVGSNDPRFNYIIINNCLCPSNTIVFVIKRHTDAVHDAGVRYL